MNPFFSIVVPTYNRAALIGETIETILAQDFPDFELIIVDDGSKDDTAAVVGNYSDPRLRYLCKENGERGAARNFGFRHAKGDYVVFFDSDDWMHADHLSTLKQAIDRQPRSGDFFSTKFCFKTDEGKPAGRGNEGRAGGRYGLDEMLRGNVFGCLVAVPRIDRTLCYFEEDRRYAIMEDWLFLVENLSKGRGVQLVDKVTISMRAHDGRSMANNLNVIKACRLATAWILERIPLSPAQRSVLLARSAYLCGVHYYLEGRRRDALGAAREAARHGGIDKHLLALIAKSIIGRKWIAKLK